MVQSFCKMQVNPIDISWYLHHECSYHPNRHKCYHNLIFKKSKLPIEGKINFFTP